MYKDVHFEVVLSAAGTHRIYFSDATREDLPASVATGVTVTIERPRFSPEVIQGAIDGHGESWIVDGAPVVGTDVSARVAFALGDDHYFIDMPFIVDVRSRTE